MVTDSVIARQMEFAITLGVLELIEGGSGEDNRKRRGLVSGSPQSVRAASSRDSWPL